MKILSVCGNGLGSSLILKMAVEKVLKSEDIKANVVVSDLGNAKGLDADYIVASPEIAERLKDHKATVIAIKNMMDKNEIKEKLISQINQ
ncbi:MAG TPA: PTS sugar transporter subunit IIB [Clostridia bacterium]|nr:PTS sugar transporter subunit IIB [Clostridia bacterium]